MLTFGDGGHENRAESPPCSGPWGFWFSASAFGAKPFLNQKSCQLRATMDFVRKILRLLFSQLQLLVFRRTFYANPCTHSGFGIDSIAVFNLQATEDCKLPKKVRRAPDDVCGIARISRRQRNLRKWLLI